MRTKQTKAKRTSRATRPDSLLFVRAWRPLSDTDIRAALANWSEGDPRFRALWDLLSREIEACLAELSAVKSNPHDLLRWVGRIEASLAWRQQLMAFRVPGRPGMDS